MRTLTIIQSIFVSTREARPKTKNVELQMILSVCFRKLVRVRLNIDILESEPAKVCKFQIYLLLKRVARCLALSLATFQPLGCLAAHISRPRLIGCTFRAYISISRLLFDFLKNGGFRPLHRLTNMRVWLIFHFQYVLNESVFISEFRK